MQNMELERIKGRSHLSRLSPEVGAISILGRVSEQLPFALLVSSPPFSPLPLSG